MEIDEAIHEPDFCVFLSSLKPVNQYSKLYWKPQIKRDQRNSLLRVSFRFKSGSRMFLLKSREGLKELLVIGRSRIRLDSCDWPVVGP